MIDKEKNNDNLALQDDPKDIKIYNNTDEFLNNKFWNSVNQGINLLVGLYEGIQSTCRAAGFEESDFLTEINFSENKSGINRNMHSNEVSTSYSTRVSSLTNFNEFGSGTTTKSSSIQDLSYINNQYHNKDLITLNNINNDPTIQLPHTDVPDLSTHTKMYATRSHILFTILCCQYVEKIIETNLICGDFKLKGPGFRVENVYIPIRNEKQIIELKLTTFNKNGKRNDLMVDIPLSAIHKINDNYQFWLILSSDKDKYSNEYNDILPEAVFRLKVDNENYKLGINKPRVLVNLKRVMCGIIEDSHSFNRKFENISLNNSNFKSSLIYVGLYTDSLDMELSQILNSNPVLLLNNNIERLSVGDGHYKINNIEVIISYGTGKFCNTLFVQDETSRQPLIDYLNNTNDNIEWLTNQPSNATELVPQGILPDFTGTPAPWEVETDRRKAMELACHRVALREHIALQYLIDTGCTNLPQPKFAQWLNPPYFRIGPQYEPVPMSYNWGPNYTNIQLIPLEQPKKII